MGLRPVRVFTCLCDQTREERKRRNRLNRARGKAVRKSRRERKQGDVTRELRRTES